MSSRRQSMRVSSQTTTVIVTKTSVSSMSASSSTPSSTKRNSFSVDSSSVDTGSPEWISGSEILFKTPKSSMMSRRSTIHHDRKARNDFDFKIPSLMFSSPPGVKTRSRRSSIYQSSQQTKTNTKAQGQRNGQTAVKRAGKTAEGKRKETQITAAKVASTDLNLVANKTSKSKRDAKGRLSVGGNSPQGRSKSARSSSRSESKISESSSQASPKKSSLTVSSKTETKKGKIVVSTETEILTSSAEVRGTGKKAESKTTVASKAKSEKSPKQKKTPSHKKHYKSPERKATPSPRKQEKSPSVESPTRRGKSSRRKSSQVSRPMTTSAEEEKVLSDTSVSHAKVSYMPKKTPSPKAKTRSKSSKRQPDAKTSPTGEKVTTPRGKAKKTSKSKASPNITEGSAETALQHKTLRTPKQSPPKSVSSRSKKAATGKRASSRIKKVATSPQQKKVESPQTINITPILRIEKASPAQKNSPAKGKGKPASLKSPPSSKVVLPKRTPSRREKIRISIEKKVSSKSPQSKRSDTPKRTPSQRVEKVAISEQLKLETSQTSNKGSNVRTAVLRIEKITSAPAQQDTPSKGKGKSPTVKSPSSSKTNSPKKTPTRREKIRILSAVEKKTSSSAVSRISEIQKKTPSQRVEKTAVSSKKEKMETPITSRKESVQNTPTLRGEKTVKSPYQKDLALKEKRKSPTVKFASSSVITTPKRTPTYRESARILSSVEKQSSSSTAVIKSPALKSSVDKVNIPLRKTPYPSITSRPSRTVDIVKKSNIMDREEIGYISASRAKNDSFMGALSPHFSTPEVPLSQSAFTKTMPSSVSPLTKLTDVSVRGSRSQTVNWSRSQMSAKPADKTHDVSPLTLSSKTPPPEKSFVSSRQSLSVTRATKKSFIPVEKATSLNDFGKTLQVQGKESVEISEGSEETSSTTSWRKRKYESEDEEIDRMVTTMVQAGLPRKRRSTSPSINASKASPARITIVKGREATAATVTGSSMSKTLRTTRDITPSIAAPKARKILGVSDTSSTRSTRSSTETSQSQSISQHSAYSYKRSARYEYNTYKQGNIDRRLDLHRDEKGEDNDQEEEYATGTETETTETETTETETIETESESEKEEEQSVQEEDDVTESESEADEEYANDGNITLSHTSHSQKCTIS